MVVVVADVVRFGVIVVVVVVSKAFSITDSKAFHNNTLIKY